MKKADWYFDFISPFAYFQFTRLGEFDGLAELSLKPVLFAGLLGHWAHKGPAELPTKRRFTYRHAHWLAGRLGVPFRMPDAHPFNPLPLLRLATGLDGRHEAVGAIFRFVWHDGGNPEDPAQVAALARRLGMAEPAALFGDAAVKERLRRTTEEAAAAGAFGVPTVVVDGEMFWGYDATDMALDFLADPGRFEGAEYRRLDDLPSATARKL